MEKIDFKKMLRPLYRPSSREPEMVEVPFMSYLMIDGMGDPSTSRDYHEAIETLYALSYALKFIVKKADLADYGVLPLESLWWSDDMTSFVDGKRDQWQWTAMIMQPSLVNDELVGQAMAQVRGKKKSDGLTKVRFEGLDEGLCAQMMHLGPFSNEGATIQRLHAFIEARGYTLSGKHHEIYLSDMRRTPPDKYKTIIRQPVCRSLT